VAHTKPSMSPHRTPHPLASLLTGLLCLTGLLFAPSSLHAQGCVVAHGSGLPTATDMGDTSQPWEASISYRWFESDRHYVGTAYQAQRDAAGDQVINRSNFTDFNLTYTITPRYSVSATIPYVSHDRSQTLKNNAGDVFLRYHTQASGLADASIIGNAWVLDPVASAKGNIQLGLGLSLPTGKDDVRDTFQVFDRASGQVFAAERTVDQSIQPGTGGYGIILNVYGYRQLGGGFTGFVNANYTITPQEKNGVPTFRSSVYESTMSIPDTYLGRMGVEYAVPAAHGLSFSLALRAEGVAVYDLVGGSAGFRRPGYSVAIEPGIGITHQRWSARLYVPVAIQRDRLQSYPDKQRTWATGTYTQGDAAFANYLVILSLGYKF
jgi:hypothetical protein